MTKRLQVLVDDDELEAIQHAAQERQITVAAWVRGALRSARQDAPATTNRKLAALRQAMRHDFPTADIETMVAEIESGYAAAPHRGATERPPAGPPGTTGS